MLFRRLVVSLLVGVVVTGCATQRTWVYRANTYSVTTTPKGNAVVLPYRDNRLNENHDMTLLYMIPIMPFGWTTQNTPEGVMRHITSSLWNNYKPTEDYPKALVEDLRNARLFTDAFFGYNEGDANYVIQGTIRNTLYTGKVFSYGLSVYGPMLWIVGLPAGNATNSLSVEMACIDKRTGRAILTKVYDAPQYSATSFLYSMANDFNYPEMLANVNKQFVDDLRSMLH